jgi:hypothetical protein
MFCEKRHYKNPTCFGPYSMTIFRGRPSFLVHLLPFSCLLRHLSFSGKWPYAIYLYVCPVYIDSTQTGTPVYVDSTQTGTPVYVDSTQTGTPDTHTNRWHTATYPKKDK